MADIACTVPNCEVQAVLVLNGRPICRPHCEEFAKQAYVLDGSLRDVLKEPADERRPIIAGQLPRGLDLVADDANTPR